MINRFIFSQKDFDSGSLTVLASVIHKFDQTGEYHGNIFRDSNVVGKFSIQVYDTKSYNQCCNEPINQSATMDPFKNQINIDLKCLDLPVYRHLESIERNCYQLRLGGFAVFYVSTGIGGYSVEIKKVEPECGPKNVFDSKRLSIDDLFAVTILRPGTYSINNDFDEAKAELMVSYPERGKIPKKPKTVKIECSEKGFNSSKIEIKPTQGLVFSFKKPSRIKIELIKQADKPSATKTNAKGNKKEMQKVSKKIKRHIRIYPKSR